MNDGPGVIPLTSALYDSEGMRALDAAGMALPEIAPGELMERAGAALLAAVRAHWPEVRRLGILCGPGNNGGDGYVLARLAAQAGLDVRLHGGPSRARPESDGRQAHRRWIEHGGAMAPLEAFDPADAELWVDCLFGIGLERPLHDAYGEVVERLNASGRRVLAADIPSGVNADTGAVPGPAVRARHTVTMIADKLGLHTGAGVDYAGTVEVARLDLPEQIARGVMPRARHLGPEDWQDRLPARRPGAHKGNAGHVLVVGGAPGFSGAARLTALAALRAGAGRVTLATHEDHAAWANADRPEIMVRAVREPTDLLRLARQVDVIAAGPGLGTEEWGRRLWHAVADAGVPLVVDADALNLLAATPRQMDSWILTPHPGEAGRLLNRPAAEVEANRPAAVLELAQRFGGVSLLKGAGTLVADADPGVEVGPLSCVTGGHAGMAVPGSGDVLTGIIVALRAQGLEARAAAEIGAAWHCAAGRVLRARLGSWRGLLAGELADALPAAAGEEGV
ncbi:NAD(P)H-hydrate dehydratase [Thioalkalivibrio sp. ALJ9]|uniref:NAD(P)H-hydrate dehydratase n=1 Tax=Thioalkalivibrio sp. ALJ9 TaxID=1158758 RepID=UPI0004764AD9|nr:NAD(P)H-hydrate dehydratase [Thioalkalivibrio sp. ALJ9]